MSQMSIRSDGSPAGTYVLLDGKVISGVQSVAWQVDLRKRSLATITVKNVPIHFTGDMQQTDEEPTA